MKGEVDDIKMDKYDKYLATGIRLVVLLMFVVLIVAVFLYTQPNNKLPAPIRNGIVNVPMQYEEAGER